MDKAEITADWIKNVLDYDPETGLFIWKQRFGKRGVPGKQAGTVDFGGYLVITINGKRQTANGKRQTANGKRQTAQGASTGLAVYDRNVANSRGRSHQWGAHRQSVLQSARSKLGREPAQQGHPAKQQKWLYGCLLGWCC